MELEQQLQAYLNNIASYFKKIKGHSIGIDLGSNNLKVVELHKVGGKIKLKNYALVKMNKILTRDELRKFSGRLVSKVLKEMSVGEKEVNIAIPSYSSLITLVEVSGQTEDEIKREVEYEAAKYIPVDLNEVVFDWQIIESNVLTNSKNQNGEEIEGNKSGIGLKQNKVLLVSVMKDISSKYQKSFNNNNLKIDSIEVDCFSSQRSLLPDDKKSYVILDIGGKITNVIGVYRGQLLFNRNIDLAGEKITELIAKSLKVSKARAEKVKVEQGFESDSKTVIKNILEPTFDSIVEQAQKNIEEFDEFKGEKIEKLILSGGTSELRGVKKYIQSKMKTEVVYGNPWSKIEYPEEIKKKIISSGPYFSVAVGLALIGLESNKKNKK